MRTRTLFFVLVMAFALSTSYPVLAQSEQVEKISLEQNVLAEETWHCQDFDMITPNWELHPQDWRYVPAGGYHGALMLIFWEPAGLELYLVRQTANGGTEVVAKAEREPCGFILLLERNDLPEGYYKFKIGSTKVGELVSTLYWYE